MKFLNNAQFMNNAEKICCDVLSQSDSSKYYESIRMFQGCPTIAVTKGGRIFLGWYAGGLREPHMNNYNLLIYSDDQGATWSEPLFVIPSSYDWNIHALDIQLFMDPDGALHVVWVQDNTVPTPQNVRGTCVDGYAFFDFEHNEWEMICREPDAEAPVFTKPKFLYHGFLRCKPTFLQNGDWLCFAYDQLTDRYGYYISCDQGQSFTHYYGAKKLPTWFDEAMAYQLEDGSVRMFARNSLGELAECVSHDNGRTWSSAALSGIVAADTRFFVKRLASGRIILICNDDSKSRKNMTVYLSEDDGKTWKYKRLLDARDGISYPDADEHNGVIYLTYDWGRTHHGEILFCRFTEQDIIDNNEITISTVSKLPDRPAKQEVIQAIENERLIAILRNVPSEKLLATAEALYQGGIRLIEVPFCADGSKSDADTASDIETLVKHFEGRMLIGAGTVLTDEQVRLTKAAGGTFIISPNTDKKVMYETYVCGMVSIPGALTPSEISNAHSFGADFVKVFPAASMGAEYIKAVKAPLSHIKLLAVGGIDEKNMRGYLSAGACGFGIGANMVSPQRIAAGDYDGLTALAKKYTEVVCHG